MKWESLPRSLAFGPLLLGMLCAALPYLVEHPYFKEGSLLAPFLLSMMLVLQFPFFPESGEGRKAEMIGGIYVGALLSFLPQFLFYVWFIVMILLWVQQSNVIWQRNYPPFRVGLWIGLGVVSGLFIGGILAHIFL